MPASAAARASAAGLVVLAVIVTVDAIAGDQLVLTGLYGAPALVAAVTGRRRATVVVAAMALVAAVVSGTWNENFGTRDHAGRLIVVTAVSLGAIYVAHIVGQQTRRLTRMTAIAEQVQRAVLRDIPTNVGSVAFAARYVSATDHARIGGDLYEVVASPHGVRVLIGDVRGKGLEAVHLAAEVMSAFRVVAFDKLALLDVADQMGRSLARGRAEEEFVTALLLEFRPDGSFTAVNAGHHPPLLVPGNGDPQFLEPDSYGLPFGIEGDRTVSEHRWDVGDRLLLYTDGLVESRDRLGEFFDVLDAVPCPAQLGLEACLDDLAGRLMAHVSGRLRDDLALVLAERTAV